MSIHIWESPSPKDHLLCQREIGNPHNTHAVAVKGNIVGLDGTTTVEHAPKKYLQYVQYLLDVEELSIVL